LPHAPQLLVSLAATQVPPQCTPLAQPQTPLLQFSPGAHALPHAPQFATSVFRLAHAEPQTLSPAAVQLHTPSAHACPAAQALPHFPQFSALLPMSTQAPSQSTWPSGQVHSPLLQVNPASHTFPHSPQFLPSDCWSTQPTSSQ
jgi:hypothetical protein